MTKPIFVIYTWTFVIYTLYHATSCNITCNIMQHHATSCNITCNITCNIMQHHVQHHATSPQHFPNISPTSPQYVTNINEIHNNVLSMMEVLLPRHHTLCIEMKRKKGKYKLNVCHKHTINIYYHLTNESFNSLLRSNCSSVKW
jgi:hypothetical protein